MSNQHVSLTFSEKRDEEITSIFLIEDLIKEYNYKIVSSTIPAHKKKVPLSLRSIKDRSVDLVIHPMTKDEINSIQSYQLKGNDWWLLKSILQDQVEPKGLISNIPTIVQGVSIVEVINELGLKGKVYYKTIGEKTYVILKGLARERSILKGTRYLNTNPQMLQFGLAKVDVKTLFRSGFKTSILIYGAIKAVEATETLLQEGELKTSFFSQVGTDIPKIAITSAVSAAAAGTVAAAGVPVAAGLGIVLVVGFVASIALEFLDRKIGLTEKFNDAADKILRDLEEHLNDPSNSKQKVSSWDSRNGLVFGEPFARHQQVLRKGHYLVYNA